jgi:hypothetical protein
MEIRFVSSLTADDEDQFAPALVAAVTALLDQLPIAYTLRVETAGSLVLQHTHGAASAGMSHSTEGPSDGRQPPPSSGPGGATPKRLPRGPFIDLPRRAD